MIEEEGEKVVRRKKEEEKKEVFIDQRKVPEAETIVNVFCRNLKTYPYSSRLHVAFGSCNLSGAGSRKWL
jgi:hypothetical protein